MKQIILVTGSNGQLGKCLQDIAPSYPGIQFHFFSREQFQIDQFAKVKDVINDLKPSVVINTAAYTAVDKAETEKELAFLINGDAVSNLAAVCKEVGARLLHVSTDYVFDGNGTSPYKEADIVSPINTYGASKLKGEQLVMATGASVAVIRTSWVYSMHGNNFVKTMLRLMKERESIGVVSDQTGCPTYAVDLAKALVQIAQSTIFDSGIYHYSNNGPITWYDFAVAIKELSNSNCIVNPIPTTAFPTPAKRPKYSVMSNQKIKAHFGIEQKDWQESLLRCLKQLLQ